MGSTGFNYLGVSPVSFKVGSGGVTKDTLVMLDTAGNEQVIAASAITSEVIGVALTTQAADTQVAVQTYGIARCICSAAITRGDKVMFATGGKIATAAGATAKLVGLALETGAENQVIKVLLNTPALQPLGS